MNNIIKLNAIGKTLIYNKFLNHFFLRGDINYYLTTKTLMPSSSCLWSWYVFKFFDVIHTFLKKKKKKNFQQFFFASLYLLHCSYFFVLQILLIQIIWSILQRNSLGWRKLKFFNLLLKVRHLSTILKVLPNTFYYYSGTRSGVYQ